MDAEFEQWSQRVRTELVPMIKDSSVFVSITPLSKDKVDVKFAVELGLAIMYNKPIIAVIQPGMEIPEKFAKVVDRFIEADVSTPTGRDELIKSLNEIMATWEQDHGS